MERQKDGCTYRRMETCTSKLLMLKQVQQKGDKMAFNESSDLMSRSGNFNYLFILTAKLRIPFIKIVLICEVKYMYWCLYFLYILYMPNEGLIGSQCLITKSKLQHLWQETLLSTFHFCRSGLIYFAIVFMFIVFQAH